VNDYAKLQIEKYVKTHGREVNDNPREPPKILNDLIQYEQLKDEMSGLFLSSPGVDQDVMSASEIDEIFEWLKKAESVHEEQHRFKLLEHYVITFEQKPGWKMDAYQFDTAAGQTRFIGKVFRPDGKHYGSFSVMEIIWNRLLGLVDHAERGGKGCHCINCDRLHYDGILLQRTMN
jgi:hypothetical protein